MRNKRDSKTAYNNCKSEANECDISIKWNYSHDRVR